MRARGRGDLTHLEPKIRLGGKGWREGGVVKEDFNDSAFVKGLLGQDVIYFFLNRERERENRE